MRRKGGAVSLSRWGLFCSSDICRDQLSGTFVSLFYSTVFQGVCGSYSGVVRLPVKVYERVINGNVYRFDSLVL
jgi:hypothetical protein